MLALVVDGVPFDVANSLSDRETDAWLIILGELNGGEYDWTEKKWKERK